MQEYVLNKILEEDKLFTSEDLKTIYKYKEIIINIYNLAVVNTINEIKGRNFWFSPFSL